MLLVDVRGEPQATYQILSRDLDRRLAEVEYLGGDEYTIADIAIYPWYGALVLEGVYDSREFLQVHTYENVIRWAKLVAGREPVRRGSVVNRSWGDITLLERHNASDIDAVLA